MQPYEMLKFDSELFGFGVARINTPTLSQDALEEILAALKKDGVHLVYWASDATDVLSQEAAINSGGVVVDHKVTYVRSLLTLDYEALSEARLLVEPYPLPDANAAMKELAYSIGRLSRFGRDPKLPMELMEKMYAAWINNSIKKIAAKEVFIVRSNSHIAGMVTLCEKQGRADVSLIAVAEKFQGQGIAKTLLQAAFAQFIADGYEEIQVVTQQENRSACGLYERMGFQLEKVESFYHFWL